MKEITINGTSRQSLGKKATREARRAGLVPCVCTEKLKARTGSPVAEAFTVKYDEIRKLLYTPGDFPC